MIEHDLSKLSDEQIAEEVAKANATMEEMKASGENHSAWMRTRFEAHDFVLGYWQDLEAPRSVRRALLKGRDLAARISQAGKAEAAGLLYVQASEEELAAMSQVWGDDRPGNPEPTDSRQVRRARARKAA
jgi:hypothetical protein